MTKGTPKNFVIQQVYEILMQKPSDESIIGYLKHCKTSSIENTQEMVYPSGGKGNSYIGRGFGHSKHATFNIENATWNTDVLAAQNGTDVVMGETTYTKYVQIDLKEGTTAYDLTLPAVKKTGATRYIGTIYGTQKDGDYVEVLTEDDTASSGKFSYTPEVTSGEIKKAKITLDEADVTTMVQDLGCTKLSMAYTIKSKAVAQRINIKTNTMPDTALVTAYGLVADICDGSLYPCIVHGMAQIDGNWTWDLSADGDPAVHNISMEFVAGCESDNLYSIIIDTDEE
jgi:hypothetical protein